MKTIEQEILSVIRTNPGIGTMTLWCYLVERRGPMFHEMTARELGGYLDSLKFEKKAHRLGTGWFVLHERASHAAG